MNVLHHGQRIEFDSSAVNAAIRYLKDKSSDNLGTLVSLHGAKLAYRHHCWSSMDPPLPVKDFWKKQLDNISLTKKIERRVVEIENYLKSRSQPEWLGEVLRYLPRNHSFDTTVYLIFGYDNIVFDKDVAINLNNARFHEDSRESEYYLIHELAHAGYLRYHRMPDLTLANTPRELSAIVKFLTHLEGMGVMSSMRLRIMQNGFLDDDYKVLRNESERTRRVRLYFRALSNLEREPNRRTDKAHDFEVYDEFSQRPQRLWYIAGAHMAQTIEKNLGLECVRELVYRGSQEFFKTYLKL
jgi:hypothetical protein